MSAKLRQSWRYRWDKIVKTPEKGRVPDNWRIGTLKQSKLTVLKSSHAYPTYI